MISPFFNEIEFKLNSSNVEQRGSVQFREFDNQANEIKEALTQVRQDVRANVAAANTPKTARICPNCSATSIPDANGRCEFCGGAM